MKVLIAECHLSLFSLWVFLVRRGLGCGFCGDDGNDDKDDCDNDRV